ncbi:MAG: hypothetical protein ABSG74_14465 [Candidatus Bathyarchaeia archaeon]
MVRSRNGNKGLPDRYVDALKGRTTKSVLARHYTDFTVDKLKVVYEAAKLRSYLIRGSNMTNLRWLKWRITRYFRDQCLQVHLRAIRIGNTAIDDVVIGNGWKMSLEIKTPRDDVTR